VTLGPGLGQFCCSTTLSSPMGPSSADPRLALTAMQGDTGSQVPTVSTDGSLLAKYSGIRENCSTVSSRCLCWLSGPTNVALPLT
jgi:hypothetical protein